MHDNKERKRVTEVRMRATKYSEKIQKSKRCLKKEEVPEEPEPKWKTWTYDYINFLENDIDNK